MRAQASAPLSMPPTAISGRRPADASAAASSAFWAKGFSGAPDRPPASPAKPDLSVAGRSRVVLDTIRASI